MKLKIKVNSTQVSETIKRLAGVGYHITGTPIKNGEEVYKMPYKQGYGMKKATGMGMKKAKVYSKPISKKIVVAKSKKY